MKCQACNGEVMEIENKFFGETEIKGYCKECGGQYLSDRRLHIAVTWCTCLQCAPKTEVYYFTNKGSHGWLHTVCGQITQTG